jgi:diguanylate cyclase (GGDEF)-like protein
LSLKAITMPELPELPRVLIVEDDPDHRRLLCDVLAMHYGPGSEDRLVAVATGAECLAQDLGGFDVVLLDYHLPDVEGLGLLEEVLAAADVPVVFVTGEKDSAVAAEAVRRGAQDYVVKLGDYLLTMPVVVEKSLRQHLIRKENELLQAQLQRMLGELKVKNRQLEESLAKLRTMAPTDHLTGLANRRRFSEQLERQFSESVRYGHDLSCCMCDLDHYKQLNDTLGHQLGDEVLVHTAEVIRGMLRRSDLAARYGGDEFVLLLSNTNAEQARAAAQRLREQLALRISQAGNFARLVTLSIGIASLHADHPTSAEALVAMADRALYAAKRAGKDRVVVYGVLSEPAATPPGQSA